MEFEACGSRFALPSVTTDLPRFSVHGTSVQQITAVTGGTDN